MSSKVRKSIVVQGSILAMAGIISKIIGFIYRVPMANILGNSGNGIYSVAFGIYNIALTLSSYSMPLAVSKLMSERLAKQQYKNAFFLFNKAFIFAIAVGSVAALSLFIGADAFARIYNTDGLARPLRILAPTTFIVALLGTCRGFFQGHKSMVPTAISQIIEQIVNAVVSVIGATMCVRMCQVETDEASYGAMGGTMGTLAGAFVALIIFFVLFGVYRKRFNAEKLENDELTEDTDFVYKVIFLTVFPVIISQSIYQLGYTLDDLLFSNIMHIKGFGSDEISSFQGVFNTQYNQMINLPTAIATAMAAATLPSVVASYATKDFDMVHKKADMVLKINMIIAIPSFVGLAVLAEPIMLVLFPGLKEYHDTAVLLIRTGSFAVVCYALSTLTTSILQGCNRMKVPVINSGISLVIHVILISVLLYYTDLGVYALVIGNVTFPLITCTLNSLAVVKLLQYKFSVVSTFVKPFIAAAVMGLMTGVSYYGMKYLLKNGSVVVTAILLLLSMIIAGLVYFVMLYLLKAFSKEEARSMPIIKKFVK